MRKEINTKNTRQKAKSDYFIIYHIYILTLIAESKGGDKLMHRTQENLIPDYTSPAVLSNDFKYYF